MFRCARWLSACKPCYKNAYIRTPTGGWIVGRLFRQNWVTELKPYGAAGGGEMAAVRGLPREDARHNHERGLVSLALSAFAGLWRVNPMAALATATGKSFES
jgi:hypothetical protein